MVDLVTAISGRGISSLELLEDEIFAEFLGDLHPGEDIQFDPEKDFVPISMVYDPEELDPLEYLIALEKLNAQANLGLRCLPKIGENKITRLCENLDQLQNTYFGNVCRNSQNYQTSC